MQILMWKIKCEYSSPKIMTEMTKMILSIDVVDDFLSTLEEHRILLAFRATLKIAISSSTLPIANEIR